MVSEGELAYWPQRTLPGPEDQSAAHGQSLRTESAAAIPSRRAWKQKRSETRPLRESGQGVGAARVPSARRVEKEGSINRPLAALVRIVCVGRAFTGKRPNQRYQQRRTGKNQEHSQNRHALSFVFHGTTSRQSLLGQRNP